MLAAAAQNEIGKSNKHRKRRSFDSERMERVSRHMIASIVERDGIVINAAKIIKINQNLLRLFHKSVRVENTVSEPFEINNGFRQGDALSHLLFNIALEKAVKSAEIKMQNDHTSRT